jgi:hypothetical protein
MKNGMRIIKGAWALLLVAAGAGLAAQDKPAPYPKMAPLEQYMMERNAEIALARTAAPPAVSDKAEVLVLEKNGYVRAAEGSNGFVCLVQRSWFSPVDDAEFWNPRERAPGCFNAAAARSYLRVLLKRTELVLAGQPKEQAVQALGAAIDRKELSAAEPGAMCYMQSRQQFLSDRGGNWHPHLMFFVDQEPESWAANQPGSPVLAGKDPANRLTVFMIPVSKWSDGTGDGDGQQAMMH